ncbi:MAG: Gfo/Idh/MocA family oxidoreductase [Patescibacteria group bacterium]|nr:Gfo/Idh/MocA family oxidoreductase [Patescibacteria group bacterium]MDE2438856.1 Gfo/Idh/MocA family oxidoreductase [Patescibacteria group bacterium]
MKNYILVGLGPHAKRIYYPFLEKYRARFGISLKLLIELESQAAKIDTYLSERDLQPEHTLFIPDNASNRAGTSLDPLVLQELERLVETEHIDGIIISTEPKVHKIYAMWALQHNIHVLMDKPVTAPLYSSTDLRAARQIYEDYLELEHARQGSRAKFYIMCQRRNHKGYTFIRNYLKDFVSEFEIPVSYIDVYHADGAWNLPHEFGKENHPYKYGYGKLMHSGYHFVDLFAWLAGVNAALPHAQPDAVRVFTAKFTPNDFFHQINEKAYDKLFHRKEISDFYRTYDPIRYDHFGELDAYISTQLMQGPNVITTGSINLQQNSFSRRSWFELPEDTYKGNGRVRHERVTIQVSHFLNIHVHSYQSHEPSLAVVEEGGVGSDDHFEILVFRNKKIVGGEVFQKINMGKEMRELHGNDAYYFGHNENAREVTLLNFIEANPDDSEFVLHGFTNQLLSHIYQSIAQGANTGNAQLTFYPQKIYV